MLLTRTAVYSRMARLAKGLLRNNCVSCRSRSLTRAVLYWLQNRGHRGADRVIIP
jgi:hypothetical protein